MSKKSFRKKARHSDDMEELYLGDCLDVLNIFPDNYFDLFCSDPPYRVGILGQEWDQKDRDFAPIWRKVLRVLKPGAFAYILCGARQDCFWRTIVELSLAGFKIDFSPFFWAYANGFPKAHSVAKALDKKEGRVRRVIGRNPNSRERCTKDNTLFRSGTVGKTDYVTVGDSPLEGAYAGCQIKPAIEIILVAMKPLNQKAKGHGVTGSKHCRELFSLFLAGPSGGTQLALPCRPKTEQAGKNSWIGWQKTTPNHETNRRHVLPDSDGQQANAAGVGLFWREFLNRHCCTENRQALCWD